MTIKLNAQQLRETDENVAQEQSKDISRNEITIILENVYDTYNVGGIFRLADALCVKHLYLCGEMEIPPNPRIQKSSIGTYKIVPWSYKSTTSEAIEEIRSQQPKTSIVAIEQDKKSKPYNEIQYNFPIALISGNETYGILPETLDLVDATAEIPMWGVNKSLNIIVATAIVSYEAMKFMPTNKY